MLTCHPRVQFDRGGRRVKKSEEVVAIQCDRCCEGEARVLGAQEACRCMTGMGFAEEFMTTVHCGRGPCSGITKIWACGPGKQLDLCAVLLIVPSSVERWLPEKEAFFFSVLLFEEKYERFDLLINIWNLFFLKIILAHSKNSRCKKVYK